MEEEEYRARQTHIQASVPTQSSAKLTASFQYPDHGRRRRFGDIDSQLYDRHLMASSRATGLVTCPYCNRRSIGEENGTIVCRDSDGSLRYQECPLCEGTQTAPVALVVAYNMLEDDRHRNFETLGTRLPVTTTEKLRADYLKGDLNRE